MQNGTTTATSKQTPGFMNRPQQMRGSRPKGFSELWDEISIMKYKGWVGNELNDHHFSVASTFRQRGTIQFIILD